MHDPKLRLAKWKIFSRKPSFLKKLTAQNFQRQAIANTLSMRVSMRSFHRFISELHISSKVLHWRGIEPRSPAWQARILPLNQQCSRAANVPTQKLALSQKRVKDTQNWPRWGSNPQSSDSKSDALSIGPRGRCLCRNLAWHHRKSYSDAWPTMASSCDLKCFTYNLFPSLNYLI